MIRSGIGSNFHVDFRILKKVHWAFFKITEIKGCQWVKKWEFMSEKNNFNINFINIQLCFQYYSHFPTRNVLKPRIILQKPDLYNKIALLSGLLTYYESM